MHIHDPIEINPPIALPIGNQQPLTWEETVCRYSHYIDMLPNDQAYSAAQIRDFLSEKRWAFSNRTSINKKQAHEVALFLRMMHPDHLPIPDRDESLSPRETTIWLGSNWKAAMMTHIEKWT